MGGAHGLQTKVCPYVALIELFLKYFQSESGDPNGDVSEPSQILRC